MDELLRWLLGVDSALALAAIGGAVRAWRDLAELRRDHAALTHRVEVVEEALATVATDVKQSRHDLCGASCTG